jgi:predicted ATPase
MTNLESNSAFILTGAPGVGKTSLLKELEKASFRCVSEPARIILAEQRAGKGEALPEKNPKLFCELLLQRSIQDYEKKWNHDGLVVFDRGVPDNIAYAACFGLDASPYLRIAKNYPYNRMAFLIPPWEEIYSTDDERKMNFRQVCEFHQLIRNAYTDLGYNLVEVPRCSIQERASFIKGLLNAN